MREIPPNFETNLPPTLFGTRSQKLLRKEGTNDKNVDQHGYDAGSRDIGKYGEKHPKVTETDHYIKFQAAREVDEGAWICCMGGEQEVMEDHPCWTK